MGGVYEEFQRELKSLALKCADNPRRELLSLYLMALEREELVSVGYREDMMVQRLDRMPIDAPVRELIHHALVWAWKDEEMHAIYIRGAILKMGDSLLSFRAFVRQMAGAIGGWASSVRQHVHWRQAPFSRFIATLVTWAGIISGQIPKDVREHLRYRPFREFCLFNVDAEKTAELCWGRIIEMAGTQKDLPPNLVDDFRRVKSDEDRHCRIFQILADALDAQDRLAPGESADSLAARIGEVGEYFLPRSRRKMRSSLNKLGSGGDVHVAAGKTASEKRVVFRRLLEECGFEEQLRERARETGKEINGLRVAIKATFMLGYHRKDRSTMTDPDLLDELGAFLAERGCADVAVIEGRNIYDRFYANRSVGNVARYLGIQSPHFRIVDASEEQVEHSYFRGMGQYTVARTWKDADFRISFSKMRSHPIEIALLTVGNLEWIGARCDEFIFVERQAHRETAVMMLIDEFQPHFALLDAYENAPDGLIGVMGCPRPKHPLRIYAGADALAVDQVAARHMGIKDPRDSSVLRAACHWFGDFSREVNVVGIDEPVTGWRGPYYSELSTLLSLFAFPVYVLGSGRGALFVPEMDEEAFPPLQREKASLRISRWSIRVLLGLRHSK